MFKKIDPRETRRENLRYLVNEYGQAVVAKLVGKPDRQIADILAGRKTFGEKLARDMAISWSASMGELIDLGYPGLVPDREAGKLLGQEMPNTVDPIRLHAPVPLISWVQAGDWCGVVDNFAPGDADEWLPCPKAHGPNTFALRVRGVSMEPKYRDGAVIFVDPARHADHLSNVVVRMEDDKEATFKQLVIEGDKRFLRPLNPDWPGPKLIEINGTATICGVVIGQFIED